MSELRLAAREYKILLDPSHFAGDQPAQQVNSFWRKKLIPAIAVHLDKRRGGMPRHDGEFDKEKQRDILFRDTAGCVLSRAGYSLRERAEAGGKRKLTLKLRLPDLFIVAATDQVGSDAEAETVLEEDIAPLAAPSHGPRGPAVLANPRSIRSRFSLSTTQPTSTTLSSMDDLFDQFPTLADGLKRAQSKKSKLIKGELIAGPAIRETVFEGARVKLGGSVDGKFALSLWYFDAAAKPGVAEISFGCKFPTNAMPLEAARRAFDLFVGLQDSLEEWLDLTHSSKTALALPAACSTGMDSQA